MAQNQLPEGLTVIQKHTLAKLKRRYLRDIKDILQRSGLYDEAVNAYCGWLEEMDDWLDHFNDFMWADGTVRSRDVKIDVMKYLTDHPV